MMNEAQHEVATIRAGYYSSKDAWSCGCHGSGWILTQTDVWVECPAHRGLRHPEDYEGVSATRIYVVVEMESGSVDWWFEDTDEGLEAATTRARDYRDRGFKVCMVRRFYS
jgi:hypothetical protein